MAVGNPLEVVASNQTELRYERCAVAFLDVVGFSEQMGTNEEATFKKWNRLRTELIIPLIQKYGGECIKSLGDGVLATFPQASSAVEWAINLQKSARSHGESLTLRIALGFGDVIRDADNDVAGDCVNITARLESKSRAGGVILSEQCQKETSGAFDHLLHPTGPLRLKNIAQDIHAYHVEIDGRLFAMSKRATRFPSIAVLPFDTSEEEAVFSSGLADDIIVSLGGIQELTVIASSSVKALGQHSHLDPREIGEVLGVDYIVSGSIRKSHVAFRAETKLIDATNGEVLSTDKSVFKIEDLFEVQDKFVEKLVGVIAPEVKRVTLERALRKPPSNFTAYENMLRALGKITSFDPTVFETARTNLEAAIHSDPEFANPYAWIARWHTIRVGQGWSDDPAHDNALALEMAQKAMRLNRRNALALATYGHVVAYTERDYETAIHYLDQAISAGPNSAIVHALRTVTLCFLGQSTEAIESAHTALRLSPFDEQLFQFYSFLALALYVDGQFEKSAVWARRSLAENPFYTNTLKVAVIAKAASGDIEAAKKTAKTLMMKEPEFRLSRYLNGPPIFSEKWRVDQLVEHFGMAGIPA